MEKRVSWINYKDKKIIYMNLSKMAGDEYLKILHEYESIMEKQPAKSVLSLTNMKDARVYGETLNETKRVAKKVRPKTIKRAVVGLSATKKILAQAVNIFAGGTPTKPFDSIEDAKDYLVK